MKNYQPLLEHEDHWQTTIGAWLFNEGKSVIRGKNIFTELRDIEWMRLFLYGITGRMFDDKAVRLFESIWVIGISYPDPRLWANRVAALAGTARSTGSLALSGAIATCEGYKVGHRANIRAIDFFLRARQALEAKANEQNISLSEMKLDSFLEELVKQEMKKHRGVAGYGRPIDPPHDERIEPMMEIVHNLGFENGFYVGMAFKIEKILKSSYKRLNFSMNISGLAASLAADQGLTAHQYYCYLLPSFSAGIMPCYIDALEKPEGCFFPLRCDRVLYEGKVSRRQW